MSDQEEVLMYNLRFVLRENQEKRLFLLRKLFEMSFGTPCLVAVSLFQSETGWYEHDIHESARYLSEEGLLTIQDDDGSDHHPRGPYLLITHKGIVEVEQSITSPTKATEHFAATVIQNFNASVGSVQTSPHSVAHVTQNFGAGASDVLNLIRELRQSLQFFPSDQRQEVIEVVDALEEEVQSPSPRKGRVKAFLSQLGSFTANTTSNVIATAIAKSLGM